MKASTQSVYEWENTMNNIVLTSLFEVRLNRKQTPVFKTIEPSQSMLFVMIKEPFENSCRLHGIGILTSRLDAKKLTLKATT